MSTAYRIAPSADRDIIKIGNYIARDNPRAAERMLDRFERKFAMTARQPLIGEACPDLKKDLRFVIEGRYVIYYRPLPSGPYAVEIVRVIHGAQNIGPDLF